MPGFGERSSVESPISRIQAFLRGVRSQELSSTSQFYFPKKFYGAMPRSTWHWPQQKARQATLLVRTVIPSREGVPLINASVNWKLDFRLSKWRWRTNRQGWRSSDFTGSSWLPDADKRRRHSSREYFPFSMASQAPTVHLWFCPQLDRKSTRLNSSH